MLKVLNQRAYSLRTKLLVSEMDVSKTKIHLDTSIPATSNSERREYLLVNSAQFDNEKSRARKTKGRLSGEVT